MIKFGTSGWRGIIGEDFTFENVRVATQGVANYLKKSGQQGTGVIVAYDTRFLSEKFASEVTKQIEREIHEVAQKNERLDVYERTELIEEIDPKDRYLTELRQKVDADAIRKSGLRIAIDSLFGTSRDYLDYFLLEAGLEVKIIHNYRDPYFGGFSPECNEKNLAELRKVVSDETFDLGLATDGDADRFGIIDDRNRFVSPNTVIALLSVYLKRYRNIPGGLARSVATTHLIDAIARKLDVPLYETPVGFKYIGELILADKIAVGGEESAGMSMYRHLPEKDGILACLLVAEMVARTGKRIPDLVDEMHKEFGYYYSKRADMKLTPQLKESLAAKLANPPAK